MKREIIAHEDPKSPITEVFKTIRTNLQFMKSKSEAFSILITSTMPGEGKSWVASNLGVAFAQSNKKVVLIDSDMRKGRLHSIFGTNIFPGLSNYLTEETGKITDYCIKTEIENLWIIPTGNVPPNPSELLSNERMLKGLEELKSEFDIIIFDSTPCMLVTDAVIISRIVNTTIIVSAYKTTKMENLKEVQKNIENVGGRIAGVLINRIPISLKKYKSKYYYYGDRNKKEEIRLLETKSENSNNAEKNKTEVKHIAEQDEIKEENEQIQIEEILNVEDKKNDGILNQIDEFLKKKK